MTELERRDEQESWKSPTLQKLVQLRDLFEELSKEIIQADQRRIEHLKKILELKAHHDMDKK